MVPALLMVIAVSLPPNAEAVRIAADAWATPVDTSKVEPDPPAVGERIWWWSPKCAPAQLTSDAPAVECGAIKPRTMRVIDGRGKGVAGARLIWGTAEMLTDMPETMLPALTCGDDGSVAVPSPASGSIFVRAAGAHAASWWQKVKPANAPVLIRASEGMPLRTGIQLPDGAAVTRSILEIEPVSVTMAATDIRSWGASERDAVELLPLPRMAVRYTAWSDDAAPQAGVATTGAFPRTLLLQPGTQAEGLVFAPKHVAVPDAAVEAVFVMPGGARGLQRRARSDGNGHFVLRGLAAGSTQVLVRKPGYATVIRMVRLGGTPSVQEYLLRHARSLKVVVVDRSDQPVPSADVRTADGAHANTGKDGVASLDSVPAGENVLLQVRARGFRNAEVRVPSDAKGKTKVVLSRGVQVTATLWRGETHQPAGPGTVMIVNNGGRHIESFDASGVLELSGLAAGTLSLEIRADGAAPFAIPERDVAGEERVDLGEVRLPTGPSIKGSIVSRQSGAPIANAHVRLLRRSGFGPIGAFVMRDWAESLSAEDGSFTVGGFEAGPQLFLVEAAGFAARLMTQEVRQDALMPVDAGTIDLETGRELIVDCTPVPRCGNEARLLFAGAEFPWASIGAPMQSGTAHLLPAGSGTATLRLLAGGRVVDERSVEIPSQSDLSHIHVKLVSTAVTGTVMSAGKPHPSGQVRLERVTGGSHVMPIYFTHETPQGNTASSSWMTDSPDVQIAAVDSSGRFQFDGVQPGQYNASYRFNGTSAVPIHVTVPESDQYDFSIELPLGEVRGRVTDEHKVPVKFSVIEVRDTTGELHTGQTDGGGDFSLIGLPAGKAVVRAANRDGEGQVEVTIEPPRVSVADVVLEKHDRKPVTVAVVDPFGQPLPGATVFLIGSGLIPAAVGTTDGSGIATFRLSKPLNTSVVAYQSAYGWSWLSARPLGSDASEECTLRMAAATGSVVVSSKTGAAVELYAPSHISLGGAFSFLGVPVSVAPGAELRLSGLPPGVYALRAGAFQTIAEVETGKDALVTIR